MKYGAWIHTGGDVPLEQQIKLAAQSGMQSIRSYSFSYAKAAAPFLRHTGMALLAGMHIDAKQLIEDWRSQVDIETLAQYHELDIPLRAICVGNELREGGDDPATKKFTARLSFNLSQVIKTYRSWMEDHDIDTPLTYAMEGLVQDGAGNFNEWVLPLIDTVDIVGLNLYPMGYWEWFTFRAFEESRKFLQESRTRNDRLTVFEHRLRCALAQLNALDKPLILTETGFPSAVSYHIEDNKTVVPESDNALYAEVMHMFVNRIENAAFDYDGLLQEVYFYEWRDNLYHRKITNVEQSPIHVAFGLCDRFGQPKFDIKALLAPSN